MILSDCGLADNPQVNHCLSQLRNIALQKRIEGIRFYKVSVKNMLLGRMERILGILRLCRILCKTDQFFLGLILGHSKIPLNGKIN